jgi:ABC-type transporter Mla subunit MlaD
MAMSDEEINALNESIRELNDSMKMMADTFASVANQSKKVSDNLNNVSTGAKNADTNTNAMAKATIRSKGALDQFSDSTEEATKRQQAYKDAQASGIQATLGFADALISTEAGFTKFSGALSAAGDAAMELGKSQGPVGEVLGRIVKAGTIVGEQYLEQADAVLKATDSISRMGGVNTFTADQVRLMGESTGLAWNELDKLIKPMTSMGGALKVLGGSSSESAAIFASMNDVTRETRESFQRLGLDDEQRIEATADYVQLMFKSGTALSSQQKTQENLIKLSEHLDKLELSYNTILKEYESRGMV